MGLGRRYGPKREWLLEFVEVLGLFEDPDDAIDLKWELSEDTDRQERDDPWEDDQDEG